MDGTWTRVREGAATRGLPPPRLLSGREASPARCLPMGRPLTAEETRVLAGVREGQARAEDGRRSARGWRPGQTSGASASPVRREANIRRGSGEPARSPSPRARAPEREAAYADEAETPMYYHG